jgi:alanyl-tRNA synthetase
MRIIADHLRGSIFLIHGGVEPANKLQGYFLRRLIRRVTLKLNQLTSKILSLADFQQLVLSVIRVYQALYFDNLDSGTSIAAVIYQENERFQKSLQKGLQIINKTAPEKIDGQFAFDLYQSYGFPLELTQEIIRDHGFALDQEMFAAQFQAHQSKSRTAAKGLFKGGLADHSAQITQFHTTTHLLHQALRDVLGDGVQQMGSNITRQRLRFDFKHSQKLTDPELKKIESIINEKIRQNLPVTKTIEPKDQALKSGALAFFREKYPDTVSVYTIGKDSKKDWYSKELCGGPHVASTGQIGTVRIKKEESVGAGVRRLYLVSAAG